MKIGFIGLGNMGGPMAANLAKAGHDVTAFDMSAAALDKAAAAGITRATTAAGAAAGSQAVVTMLPAGQHVRSVYLGDTGILAGAAPGTLFIDSSTIDVATAREVHAAAGERRVSFLDAPVSGGVGGAAAGTLTFMVGATPELFAQLQPVLQGMGHNIVHCGATGMGQVAKICNNLLLAVSMVGVAEAMSLGAALGIDPQVLAGIVNTSSGRCWSADTYNPYPGVLPNVPASRGYSGGFGVDLMLKDLGLANEAARQVHQALPLGAQALQLYEMWSRQGHGQLDFSSIIRMLQGQRST